MSVCDISLADQYRTTVCKIEEIENYNDTQ